MTPREALAGGFLVVVFAFACGAAVGHSTARTSALAVEPPSTDGLRPVLLAPLEGSPDEVWRYLDPDYRVVCYTLHSGAGYAISCLPSPFSTFPQESS